MPIPYRPVRIAGKCARQWRKAVALPLYKSGIGEVGLFLAGNLGEIELPVAVTFAGVGQRTIVGGKGQTAFVGRGVGDLLGGSVVCRSYKDLATSYEGYLLAIR